MRVEDREDDVVSLDDFEEDIPPPYAKEFCDFIDEAATTYHAVAYFKRKLNEKGFVQLQESDDWTTIIKPSGKYYLTRAASSIVAFAVGSEYQPGDPFAIIGTHIDALCLKVKPYSKRDDKGGWERLGVAPYSVSGAGQSWDGSFSTWWDRDLGLGGRVLIGTKGGKVEEKLVRLPGAVGRIPTLAVHFGEAAKGPFNYETNMVPIMGLRDSTPADNREIKSVMGKQHSGRLLRAVASTLGPDVAPTDILDFSLELFDSHPSTLLGLSSEFISAPRMDDRLCSFAAGMAFINSVTSSSANIAGAEKGVRMVAMYDTEEVGSVLRQGAKSNFMRTVVERVVEAGIVNAKLQEGAAISNAHTIGTIAQTLARSFLISADVAHAYNPNFDNIYLEGASPLLNKGPSIYMDANGHMTSDAMSTTLVRMLLDRVGKSAGEIQILYPRSDSRTGGTIGPSLSQDLGIRAIDMGIPILSMHSIRNITGAKDVGLAVALWEGFYNQWWDLRSVLGDAWA